MAGAVGVWLVHAPGTARAEFEVPEVDGEKGGIELEYRGARHWGLPRADADGEIDALRQSHEVEIQYAITDYWMIRVTPNFEEPAGDEIELFTVGIETQFVLVPRKGGAFGLALMVGYGPAGWFVDAEEPDEIEFGPVVELANHRWLVTLNPRLVDQAGAFADQDGLGFEYASQVQYRFTKHWSVAAMAFGEIEDLAHAGSFNAQTHAIGPSLYWFSDPHEEEFEVVAQADEPREAEWSMGLGALLGLTSATPDVTLRATLRMEY